MGMTKEAAYSLFVCTQYVLPIPGEHKLKNLESAAVSIQDEILNID